MREELRTPSTSGYSRSEDPAVQRFRELMIEELTIERLKID
jgi:hypothetical protein